IVIRRPPFLFAGPQEQWLRLGPFDCRAESKMIDQANGLDSVHGRNSAIVNGYQVVAVGFLTAVREAGGAGEDHGIGPVEVYHNKLVVNYLSRSGAHLLVEGRRHV